MYHLGTVILEMVYTSALYAACIWHRLGSHVSDRIVFVEKIFLITKINQSRWSRFFPL